MAVVAIRPASQGKIYIACDDLPPDFITADSTLKARIDRICNEASLTVPTEPISPTRPSPNARGLSAVTRHGITTFGELFSKRQLLTLLTFTAHIKQATKEISTICATEMSKAVATYLALILDRLADFDSSFCIHNYFGSSRIAHTFGRHALAMVWDYAEANPFHEGSGGWGTDAITEALRGEARSEDVQGNVSRGTATDLPMLDASLDAVITDPPYYDNVPYADIADFFYVWLKRSIGHLYQDHFGSHLTPKKGEATALASRHNGDMTAANTEYEYRMSRSLNEAHRVLKRHGTICIVYAHKTTLGWATLVDAMRSAGFVVTEAWPLDTEKSGRLLAQDAAALASSIFLVGRKREGKATGSFETDVQPELEAIVRERVDTLWDQGISGADLVISCVGAGLRAFTRFARVEYANGDEVPAERFLTEVETVVLDSILDRLSREAGGNTGRTSLVGLDAATRFYTLWRYTYRSAELDAGEAIVFANGTHVELDGHNGLSAGARALIEKKKGKYRLRDFVERGEDAHLGMPSGDAQPAPLIDALHRTLWLMENRPGQLGDFLRDAQPNREQMRLVAQALAGPALKGGELDDVSPTGETAALHKLTSNWRSVIEDNVFTPSQRADRKSGQQRLFE